MTDEERYARRLSGAVELERARREARRILDAEAQIRLDPPTLCTLRDWLREPDQPQQFRIDGLLPMSGRVMFSAQAKAGKTSTIGDLVRALVDPNSKFLGVHDVVPVSGIVAVLDTEMAARQHKSWMRAKQIVNDHRVVIENLRGRVSSFNLLDESMRAHWANWLRLRGVQFLILDCLRPVLDSLGLDENKDAGRFLVAFDQLLHDAEILEAVVVHHIGHTGERSRGDSRLRDWPDVEWTLLRQDEAPSSPRFFHAYGRDVDVPERQLAYDPSTRSLTVVGGSRRDAKLDAAVTVICGVLAGGPALSGRAIKTALADHEISRDTVDAALRYGLEIGQLVEMAGPRNAKLYRAAAVTGSVRECPADAPIECPAAYVKPDARTLDQHDESARQQPDTRNAFQGAREVSDELRF